MIRESRSLSLIDTGNEMCRLLDVLRAISGHVYEYTKDVNKCESLREK